MSNVMGAASRRLSAVLIALAVGISACGGAATQSPRSNGAPTAPGSSASGATPAAGGAQSSPARTSVSGGAQLSPGGVDVQGSLVSSGIYAATWTWQPDNAANVGIGGVTLNSDKGTFGNIEVLSDGSITFSTGAPEISAGQPYRGKGAKVHLKNVGGADLPCSFTLDNDVTGSNGAILHLAGTLTITGTPFDC